MESRYFVLTLKSEPKQQSWSGGFEGARGGFEGARGGFEGASDEMPMGGVLGTTGAEPPAQVALETTTLTEKQARAAARDPQTTLAEEMPVALIEPMQSLGNDGAGDPLALAMAARSSWGIAGVGADKTQLTGAGVTVAVLDTGIDATHKAFEGMQLIRQNFAGGDPNDAHDRQGHGTHCAGTIFGRDVDGLRIGVARGVTKAVIGKVLDDNGRGSTIAVLNALQWAQQQGANVVSMSLGFDFPAMQQRLVDAGKPMKLATSQALKAYRENLRLFERLFDYLMLQNFMSPGMIVVAASGNESMREAMPPFLIDASLPAAASPHIISVGAFARRADRFSIAPFSNINPVLAAPGVDIVSAKTGGGLTAMNGTSMACPHVAGLAALWWEWVKNNQGRATGDLVRARVVGSALASGFAGDVTFEDRGGGCPMAPV